MKIRSAYSAQWLGILILLLSAAAAVPTAARGCVGDCDNDGEVTITELITDVQIALSLLPIDACPSSDMDGNGVDIQDLIAAVNNALNGCPEPCACPQGYTCGTSNGIAVCRAPSGVPLFEHVFVIVMENTSRATLENSDRTPYLHSLEETGATSAAYHSVAFPSLPNYLALTSGDTAGVACDCAPEGDNCSLFTCNPVLSECGCEQSRQNIADLLEAAGKSWRSYAEDMASPCNLTDHGEYTSRHVPFLYYSDIQGDAERCTAHVVDYVELMRDLPGTVPAFSFIIPNLVHDMHDPFPPGPENLTNGDAWLATAVPQILASSAYQQHGALFIVWDEPEIFAVLDSDEALPFLLLSPLAKSGYVSTHTIDHYALLATWEDGLGVPRLGDSVGAEVLDDFFPPQ